MDSVKTDWENPSVIGKNKEEAHIISMPYSDFLSATNGEESKWKISLNGTWKFHLSQNPSVRPIDFYQKCVEEWEDINVPGVWQLQGHGQKDVPYFLLDAYPPALSVDNIPEIDHERNSIGSYKRSFTVPAEWEDKEILVCFKGVKSAFYVWVNSIFVGYSQGSMTPAEFNITQYIVCGAENSIAVEVYRYCDSTYLEGYQSWFLSGIYRDVFLYAEPKIYLKDFTLSSKFDENYEDAFLKIKAEINNTSSYNKPIQICVYLSEHEEELQQNLINECRLVVKSENKTSIVIDSLIQAPKKWSDEAPYLYKGAIAIKDSKGVIITIKKFTFGFRKIEIVNGQLLINGKPVILKGINRHDFDSNTGCTISKERYEEDLKLLKCCNINAIRTSYYPNDTYFYDLCDLYGIYVMNEVGVQINSCSKKTLLSNQDIWEDAMLDMMTRIVARDKNHPSVIIWSLGSEKGLGKNFFEMKKIALRLDDTRPVHFEGDLDLKTSDFLSSKSANIEWMDAVGQRQLINKKLLKQIFPDKTINKNELDPLDYGEKPALLCEYAHGKENGLGGIKEYMDKFEQYDNWCGGFIYDFADQSICTNENGETKWLYGGDFEEDATSGYLCASGIVAADRTMHPSAFEVKKVYQSFVIKAIDMDEAKISISQKGMNVDGTSYYVAWELLEDGEIQLNGTLDLDSFANNPIQILTIPIDGFIRIDTAQYHLNISILIKQPTLWACEGYILAWEQLELNAYKKIFKKSMSQNELAVHDRKIKTEIIGNGFSCRISKLTGDITSLVYDDKEYLVSPLRLNFHRAATDTDIENEKLISLMNRRINWKKVSQSYKVQKINIENLMTEVIVQVYRKVKYVKDCVLTEYVIDGGGHIEITHRFTPKRQFIKFGNTMDISKDLSTISWLGNGFQENYSDRQTGAKVGVYSCDICDYIHSYLRPQENSNRTDIRWFTATTEDGDGLFFEDIEGNLLNVSAWPYTMEDLESASHIHALRKKDTITLNIDYTQKGIGSERVDNIGLRNEHKLLKNIEYKYGYKICRAY